MLLSELRINCKPAASASSSRDIERSRPIINSSLYELHIRAMAMAMAICMLAAEAIASACAGRACAFDRFEPRARSATEFEIEDRPRAGAAGPGRPRDKSANLRSLLDLHAQRPIGLGISLSLRAMHAWGVDPRAHGV